MGESSPSIDRELVLRAPDAVSFLVKSGAAATADLRVGARVLSSSGVELEAWIHRFDDSEYEQFVRRLGSLLIVLDEVEQPPLDATAWPPRMSPQRRALVLELIDVPEPIVTELAERNPLPTATTTSPLVWVDPDTKPPVSHDFLRRTKQQRWARYREHLEEGMGWPVSDTGGMERDLDELVTAFPDPLAEMRSPRRLLVVGFTQSGKTANFIGLSARLADAGARLIIILSGRTKILRRQTQARVDRDLIGADPRNIGVLKQEYGESHRLMSRLSKFRPNSDESWTRLTQTRYGRDIGAASGRAKTDDDAYTRPLGGLAAHDPNSPMIAVLKKTPGDLETFIAALLAAPAEFRQVPAIVIDEEADDASLNYRAKKAPNGGWAPVVSEEERSAVNRLISELVGMLDRGVYVGYTATPFASCFADADDEAGFFPNAIQVLNTPRGYFGAAHVFDDLYAGPQGALSPTAAHVREIQSGEDEQAELDDALDDWLLAGALKLFRIDRARMLNDGRAMGRLRHHSMMVHIGTTRQAQRDIHAETRDRLFNRAGRGLNVLAPVDTAARLKNRFERDVRLVSMSLTSVRGRLPTIDLDQRWVPSWDDIEKYIIRAVEHLVAEDRRDRAVLLVNSDEDREAPEYDADDSQIGRWCVLVGGLMLSRGFTVEGLTTVYFRRTASAMDTQLQLARWNGYRSYFEDSIRIYFGVAEQPHARRGPRNLLAEFASSALADARFRESLRRYGEEGTSPRLELPVFLEQRGASVLRPTAAGKMRGVVRQTGAPIEFGRRGLGLEERSNGILAVASENPVPSFKRTVVCRLCPAASQEALIITSAEMPGSRARALLMLFQGLGSQPPAEELSAVSRWYEKEWRIGLVGMSTEPQIGVVKFGALDVPVRTRSITEYDTLSTGQWNRWLRVETGEPCAVCGRTPVPDGKPVLLLLPYTTATPGAQPVWGALVQLPGRASAGAALVTRPSRRANEA